MIVKISGDFYTVNDPNGELTYTILKDRIEAVERVLDLISEANLGVIADVKNNMLRVTTQTKNVNIDKIKFFEAISGTKLVKIDKEEEFEF